DVPSVYVRPREFGRQDVRLAALAAALHLPLRTVRSRTARAERFVWLERQVPPREAEAVEQLGLKGVYTVQEGRRFYPHHGLAAVVLDPSTGEVLALANVPAFDPNQPGRLGDRGWRDRVRNRAITDPYEPGSTFKAILAAAAIEEQLVKPTDMFFCENGRYQIGR